MIASWFRRWSASSPAGLIRSTVWSSSSTPGRTYSWRSAVRGESEAHGGERRRGARRRPDRRRAVLAPEARLAGDVGRAAGDLRSAGASGGSDGGTISRRAGPVRRARAASGTPRGGGLRARLPPQAVRGRGPEPARERGHRVEQLAQAKVERNQDAGDRERNEEDERPGRGDHVPQPIGHEQPDDAAAAGVGLGHRVEDRRGAEQTDVRDHHAREGQAPAGSGRLARSPLDVPAGRREQERQQPAQRPEPRTDHLPEPARDRPVPGQERDQRDRREHEVGDADQRARDLLADVGQPERAEVEPAPPAPRRASSPRHLPLHHDREDHRPPLRLLEQEA